MRQLSLFCILIIALSGCMLFRSGNEPDGSNCVPYARYISGIEIYGDAHQWWGKADGRYHKSNKPLKGAVLVLSKTSRLKYGHVAVVDRIKGKRLITVDHANWWPGEISEDMPVMDVSTNNDWSQLRFWNEDANAFGKIYPALGFIYPSTAIAESPNPQISIRCLLVNE